MDGCGILRGGAEGDYSYVVPGDYADRPVNFVSFWDALRFTNWLHNGQSSGDTETGAYTLDGYTGDDGLWITRNPEAIAWLPSDHEWYKAAYHKNDGATGNYWDYPTATDDTPSNEVVDPDPGNNANFYDLTNYTVGPAIAELKLGNSRILKVPTARSTKAATFGSGLR